MHFCWLSSRQIIHIALLSLTFILPLLIFFNTYSTTPTLSILFIEHHLQELKQQEQEQQQQQKQQQRHRQRQQQSNQCLCVYNGRTHDFCYRLPWNKSVHGLPFSCGNAQYLEKLNLLGGARTSGLRYFVNTSVDGLPEVVMVTAFSDNHFNEAIEMIVSIRQFWPQQRVIFYDIGLTGKRLAYMQNMCNVLYRKFNFSAYPEYIQQLKQYRWKPILIAEVLKEYRVVWWLDASIRFTRKDSLDQIYALYNCKRTLRTPQMLKGSDSQARTEGNCNVTDFLFFSDPGHSIFAATAYDTYRYLPSEIGMLKETTMLESNTMLFIRTQPVANILKWAVACALEKECMGLGSGGRKFELQCSFASDDHYRKYAHCHRFDQSVFNLLMANQYGFETRRYFKDGKNLFEIYRGASRIITAGMLSCEARDKI